MKLKIFILFILLVACAKPAPVATFLPTSAPTDVFIPTPTLDLSDSRGRAEWNFLVLGSDFRADDPNRQSEHTDAFVIINIRENASSFRVTFIPIARELWVNNTLLHSVYRDYGVDGTIEFVQDAFGISIVAILYADMDNFAQFIDSIGGVKMAVPFAVDDRCGDQAYRFEQGQREVFGGNELLCLARMRKGYEDGYFSRQIVHVEILKALWTKLYTQVGTDPLQLVDAAISHPFVKIWPIVEWADLARLSIRASLGQVEYRTVSLGREETINGQEWGWLADGTQGYFYVRYPAVDLKLWTQEAINGYEH